MIGKSRRSNRSSGPGHPSSPWWLLLSRKIREPLCILSAFRRFFLPRLVVVRSGHLGHLGPNALEGARNTLTLPVPVRPGQEWHISKDSFAYLDTVKKKNFSYQAPTWW